jgi:hypothetical protein
MGEKASTVTLIKWTEALYYSDFVTLTLFCSALFKFLAVSLEFSPLPRKHLMSSLYKGVATVVAKR